ncbi:adenylyl-sulfate kinase [Paenibacillus camerounensis]|uniref:adenylyl-sulfate kinase n=1 Tax=Paenibacillus camerounensis TaxID=1243663 RepID=UPI000B040CBC|nr:adenylyl-sulfate kinase [Paenibacillus camerounensis]
MRTDGKGTGFAHDGAGSLAVDGTRGAATEAAGAEAKSLGIVEPVPACGDAAYPGDDQAGTVCSGGVALGTAGQGMTIWLTGLSGAGKSTIASMLTDRLIRLGIAAEWLDGDELRRTLGKGLGFCREDRFENIRRAVYLAGMLNRHGVVTVISLISPYAEMRDYARQTLTQFAEVYVDCPLDVCEARDVKGLYAKARRGEIPVFTGVSDPYEAPPSPELTLNTAGQTPEESVNTLFAWLTELTSLQQNK